MQGDAQSRLPILGFRRRPTVWMGCLVLCLAATSTAAAGTGSAADIRVSNERTSYPVLVFACDGSTSELENLLSQPGVLSDLQQLHAGVSLALPELNAERAALARTLNQAGIPVTAWLALPAERGYYLNADNVQDAAVRFRDFESWTRVNGVRWAGIGLDIEPRIQDFDAIRSGSKWHFAQILLARYFREGRVQRARASYAELIRQMRAGGYAVDTYQFPFIADERKMHSTLLERLAGIVDVRGDREALMLYTSFHPALDSALLWVYGPEAQAIVIGSTVGPENNPHFVPLHWHAFLRDLLVAHHFSDVIGVYNLEGCVRQGFLARLKTLDWGQPVVIPADAAEQAQVLRARIQRAIWIGSYLPYFLTGLLIPAIFMTWLVIRRAQIRRLRKSA